MPENVAYFPTTAALFETANARPFYSLDTTLTTMAREFDIQARALGASSDDHHGQVFVLGKRIAEDYEFGWRVEGGDIFFRESDRDAWGSYATLRDGRFDLDITSAVFTEAVHSALWWHLHHLAAIAISESGR